MKVEAYGTRALRVQVPGGPDRLHRLWHRLSHELQPGAGHPVEDLVPAGRSLVIILGPAGRPETVRSQLEAFEGADPAVPPDSGVPATMTVPVVYDGVDLEAVAEQTGLSTGEVVRRHVARLYTVDHLGFSPGFAYLSGGDPALVIDRRATPRPRLPAGSVALGGALSAVYPQSTPGGWWIIGRSDVALFNPALRPPALLEPGQKVRFAAVDQLSRPPEPGWDDAGLGGEQLTVLAPGPLCTVQDPGRPGWAHEGVPRAGWVDPPSAEEANRLVGNPPASALLEVTAGGLVLRANTPVTLAVTGAEGRATVGSKSLPRRRACLVGPGAEVRLETFTRGLRAYVALAGGLDLAPVLGSRSCDTLGRIGPRPLKPGDGLDLLAPPAPGLSGAHGTPPGHPPTALPDPGEPLALSVVGLPPGPEVQGSVSPSSDRTGVRLEGISLTVDPGMTGSGLSEGTVDGAVQVPGDGRPIVLLANRATTGGYPVVGVVVARDLARLAQAQPGQPVILVPAPPDQ